MGYGCGWLNPLRKEVRATKIPDKEPGGCETKRFFSDNIVDNAHGGNQ